MQLLAHNWLSSGVPFTNCSRSVRGQQERAEHAMVQAATADCHEAPAHNCCCAEHAGKGVGRVPGRCYIWSLWPSRTGSPDRSQGCERLCGPHSQGANSSRPLLLYNALQPYLTANLICLAYTAQKGYPGTHQVAEPRTSTMRH